MNRRTFLHHTLGFAAGSVLVRPLAAAGIPSLAGEVGVTMGTFNTHLKAGKLSLLDVPRLMREELDLRVIDLMTATMPSLAPADLDKLRAAGDRAGCVFTNLKMNQPGLDITSPDDATRRHSLDDYKQTMTAAARLGVRWVRPLPGPKRNDFARLASSYRELIDHGATLGIAILIENVGWIKDQPDAIPAIIQATGPGLLAQPDIGNWNDAVRFDGLAKAFPLAASCDFKVWSLGAEGTHEAYDLQRCFQIGWDVGFRGPWCLEHFHDDYRQLLRELALLRDTLRGWMQREPRQR